MIKLYFKENFMEAISLAEQAVATYTKMQSNVLYVLPLIFPIICFLFSLKRVCLSFKPGKKDISGIFSDIVLPIALITGSVVYLKLIIDNKSITSELVILFISYIVLMILQNFATIKLIKITSNKRLKNVITISYIIVFVIPIIKMVLESKSSRRLPII
jgi:hypothetical protein